MVTQYHCFDIDNGLKKCFSFLCVLRGMVFCYQNCSDLLWEKIALVFKKNLTFHRGWKGPFNTFSKKKNFKKGFYRSKLAKWSNFMHGSLCRVVKVSKRARKCWKKPQIWFKKRFSKKFLSWPIWNISIAKIWWKKIWPHYTTLGVIFYHLVKLTGHFRIY